MEEKIREILKYSVGNGNLEDELDVESTESGISQKRKMITKVEELKQQFKKGKITQDELISQICELYHVEDYGSKINYSLAVKKYQPEKKAAIVSDIFSTVLYIIGEDGIDAEKIEEIRQSVSAKSYIDDETWDMVEKAFRGVVVGVNAAVAADYYGNVWKVKSGRYSLPQGISQEQFSNASKLLRDRVGDISNDIVVQGSRAKGTAKPTSDIDIALRVSGDKFDSLINQYFKTPNPGSAKERTMLHAIETGKIQAGEAKLSGLRKELQEIFGMEVDISIIKQGGAFDNPPFIPFE